MVEEEVTRSELELVACSNYGSYCIWNNWNTLFLLLRPLSWTLNPVLRSLKP